MSSQYNFCFNCFTYQIFENNQWRCSDIEQCKKSKAVKNSQKNIVLPPSTLNPRYLFPLPLAVESWKKMGVHSIVLLIGKEIEFLLNNPAKETIKMLKEQNAYIQFYEPQKLSKVSMSQIIRLFGSALDFSYNFTPRDTVLITSDADLMVFNLFNHIPCVTEGKKIHLYSEFCEPIKIPFLRGNESVPQFQMGTIAATIEAWREIMGFNNVPLTMVEIEEYILNEFGEDFFNTSTKTDGEIKRGSDIWFADQSLISYKIHEWLKNPKNCHFKSSRPGYPRRINRISWPDSNQFLQMNLNDFDDAHLPSDFYLNEKWQKFLPFLNFVFKDDQTFLEKYIKFRNVFTKQILSSNNV